jgi:hypothetical protein
MRMSFRFWAMTMQRHHKYWPRSDYKTTLEKKFRNLPENIQLVTADAHTRIHKQSPPKKPSHDFMHTRVKNHERRCKAKTLQNLARR